ncbi:hypothetical protein A3709_20330 [Halioglobus sp. HI00S01]|uniref:hypothetical protein n=1 Tax=Halioglobus sp. HI00S01 TaxID=1822214 RepID=UPI0007C3B7BF|nr:hypothetical protein [Halioglobus sp. HI00S01]KZX57961.1 hypothetical protein A3709_20330 [Halioglobus sp. HI00S01]
MNSDTNKTAKSAPGGPGSASRDLAQAAQQEAVALIRQGAGSYLAYQGVHRVGEVVRASDQWIAKRRDGQQAGASGVSRKAAAQCLAAACLPQIDASPLSRNYSFTTPLQGDEITRLSAIWEQIHTLLIGANERYLGEYKRQGITPSGDVIRYTLTIGGYLRGTPSPDREAPDMAPDVNEAVEELIDDAVKLLARCYEIKRRKDTQRGEFACGTQLTHTFKVSGVVTRHASVTTAPSTTTNQATSL